MNLGYCLAAIREKKSRGSFGDPGRAGVIFGSRAGARAFMRSFHIHTPPPPRLIRRLSIRFSKY